ncbi:MAG: hypothetical protein IPM06_20125 [Rhizobiales bacterium]|nr:hypothetical protein [Hyphomicrobiales bacterium]
MMDRVLIWFSTGAASYVAAKIALRQYPGALVVRCETSNEDPDNYRFEADAMARLGVEVTIIRSTEYSSVRDVWEKRKFIAGPKGAPCTGEMKIAPRLAFQRPDDLHVFGYTADAKDRDRFETLKKNFFELTVAAPLLDAGITKEGTLAIVQRDGIDLPRSYAMGFPNANCLGTGCGKATSPDYWALYRLHFPENFARTAAYARKIGAKLTRIRGVRCFIDEIPLDWPVTQPISPVCDFLCAMIDPDQEGGDNADQG